MRAYRLLTALMLTTAAPLASASGAGSQATSASSPNAFGSVALPVGANRYSQRWNRVAFGPAGDVASLVRPAASLPVASKAAFVNAAVNRRISYRFDTDPNGDRWATAAETLARSAGDCEDYVIAKMHGLRRLGVPARDLYMTIGQEGASGAAHAVLLVRAGGRLYVLDNRIDRLVAESEYRGFYPIISFSAAGGSWLHGYKRGQTPPAVKAMSQVFAQGRYVPLGNSEASRRRIAA